MHIHNVATLGTTAKYKMKLLKRKFQKVKKNEIFTDYKVYPHLNLINIDLHFDSNNLKFIVPIMARCPHST